MPRSIASKGRIMSSSVKASLLVPAEVGRRRRDEMAFLPAALEILETPPSPTGRIGGWIIVAIFLAALVWASVGTVDIVASATGKIVSNGRSKVIQPLESGVVSAIHVRDGQAVKAGDILVELDPRMNRADLAHLAADLLTTELDIARLRAALSDGDDPLVFFHPPAEAQPEQISLQRKFLVDQTTEHRTKVAALDDQIRQKLAEGSTIDANIAKLEALSAVATQTADMRKALFEKQLTTKLLYLEAYQQVLEYQKEVLVQQSRRKETEAAAAALAHSRAETEAEYRRTMFGQLDEAERKAAEYSQDLAKAQERADLQILKAPVDGVVQQLAVHTIGGVVTPAQNLMVIAPAASGLEIEAMIPNKDIGFVEAGQRAEIKVDTFNFTRYGLVHGEVIGVSHDAIQKDRPVDPNHQVVGSQDASSEPVGQQLVYAARVSLDRPTMKIDDRTVNLASGMAVTVEIKTGTRRIISYLLSPLVEHVQDAFKER
jgi:hemolysin D